jgi:hypothetical protein
LGIDSFKMIVVQHLALGNVEKRMGNRDIWMKFTVQLFNVRLGEVRSGEVR